MKIKKNGETVFIEMTTAEADEALMWYGKYDMGEFATLLYKILYEREIEIQSPSPHQREILEDRTIK